jgi:hypothetical protein
MHPRYTYSLPLYYPPPFPPKPVVGKEVMVYTFPVLQNNKQHKLVTKTIGSMGSSVGGIYSERRKEEKKLEVINVQEIQYS